MCKVAFLEQSWFDSKARRAGEREPTASPKGADPEGRRNPAAIP